MNYVFQWSLIERYSDFFFTAIKNAFQIALASIIIALVIGTILAISKGSRFHLLVRFANIYTTFFRSTPLLVQLYVIYFGLPHINIVISPFSCGVIALSFNCGAYAGEIIRAGLMSISKGQKEASTALGLNYSQTLLYVILPQAFRIIASPLVGQFSYLIKDTSILAAIGIYELTNTARMILSRTFRPMEPFAVALVGYILLYLVLQFLGSRIEARLSLSNKCIKQRNILGIKG